MRIALFGGLFNTPMEEYALSAPEAVLLRFLRDEHEVLTLPTGSSVGRDVSADVFHVNHFGQAPIHLALSGTPFVFTPHDPFLVSGFNVERSRLSAALQGLVLRRAQAVVALSRREAEVLADRFRVRADRFTVIPNGLDLSLYEDAHDRPGDGTQLLAVGQLSEFKGHFYLFEALAKLAPRFPAIRLTIVSHRMDRLDEYRELSARMGVSVRVDFEGPLGTASLAERYAASDIFVQPSLAECFPVTILEAMASGKPVVATAVGGVEEEVGEGGLVVPPRDADALAAAIERLILDDNERRARGRAARARVEGLYDGRNVARRHVELYADVAARTSMPSRARQLGAGVAVGAYSRRGSVSRFVPRRIRYRKLA